MPQFTMWSLAVRSRILAAAVLLTSICVVQADDPPKPVVPATPTTPATKTTPSAAVSLIRLATTNKPEPKKPAGPTGTHEAVKSIDVKGSTGGRLQTLSVGNDGRIFALVAAGREVAWGANEGNKVGAEVQVFDGAGKPDNKWSVNFAAQSINCAPDGQVFVAGDGRIASFDSSGKKLTEVELPHIALIAGDADKLKKRAEEQKQQEIESYEEMLKEQQKTIVEITKKDPDFSENLKKLDAEQKTLADLRLKLRQAQSKKEDTEEIQKSITEQTAKVRELQKADSSKLTAVEKQQLRQAEAIVKSYKTMLDRQKNQNIDDVVKQLTSRLKLVNAVAVTDKDVYVVSGETKGYGYAVWRMDRSFQNPKQVMTGVRGCCGQMDIQAVGEELWVAQNCDHKVGRYDRDGKLIKTMGKRGRDGDAECFGGCCNPMNIRLNKDMVYTAESEGIVRCFSADGESKGVIGSVKIGGGCKNVALAVSPDGNTVYFCDQPGSKIHIMTKKPDPAKGAE